jgi:histidinol-phosphate/aromatic aminotransferase/cobyric acid decarboxylase-like protein
VLTGLESRGVIVRGGGALGRSRDIMRVTYGTRTENDAFLAALGRCATREVMQHRWTYTWRFTK